MKGFRLKVQQIDQRCLFELSGQGQQLAATLDYPIQLTELYQDWKRVYLSFYKTVELPLLPTDLPDAELRGWTISGGYLTPAPIDWQRKLVEAETRLLNEFHRWLRSAELFEIRAAIARASREVTVTDRPTPDPRLDVFLICTPLELARFPWEVWEISADFAATGAIRILRTPATIRIESGSSNVRHRARILAILGDDTGLNFQGDREAVRSLSRVAEVTFVGWQPGQTATEVKEEIRRALTHPQGWDVLFFAGHSNEAEITGGELAIAPGVSLSIREITPQLVAAKERGLQVAIFNSCSGLNLAESLIGLGFSQVAVMREPIHNRVAQEFLVQFLRHLADHQDVQESLLAACQFLRLEKNLTYPSTYLIPSLFCHPDASFFRIEPIRWTRHFRRFLPTRLEAIALAVGLALSLFSPVQSALLDARILAEAAYRNHTGQVPVATEPPPVALIQIDSQSISKNGVSQIQPIDRTYLAKLVDRAIALKAQLIGVDFVLDTPQPGDAALAQSVRTAVSQQDTWLVFAGVFDPGGEIGVSEQIASPSQRLQAYIDADPLYVALPYPNENCYQTCPFAYLLSLVHAARSRAVPLSQSAPPQELRSQFLKTIDSPSWRQAFASLRQLHLSSVSVWATENWDLHWLEPLIDFSIPSDRVYERISAWRLLDLEQPLEANFSQQIVIIAPGDDERLGMSPGAADRYPLPAALRYWKPQNWLTGGESHAYMIHHQLTQRLVIPIPDLWMVGVAVLLGKGIVLLLHRQQDRHLWTAQRRRRILAGLVAMTALYGLAGLQLYISAAILLPWLLPSAMVWIYLFPALRKQTDA